MASPITPTQVIAAAPSTIRAAPVHLSVDAKGEKIAYASNKSIFIRNLDDPSQAVQYTGHTQQTTVAKFSPSGFYIASGDISGNVRIWSCDTAEQILKNEVKVINGRITDLAWDSESQRIMAIGDGKEKWGHAFTFDSGNTVGEVSGHSSLPNVVALKQSRPFRAATAGDDGLVVFYHGAPYKYNRTIKKHTKFVYDVKFSPDGTQFVSVGADAKIFIYDAKTGDDIKEIVDEGNGHNGSIFAVSWDPSSKYLLTSSADQTVKIWSVADSKVTHTWKLQEDTPVNGQQVGNIWTEKHLVSLSFSGNLTYLSRDTDVALKVISGHQKSITALAITKDMSELYTGSYDTTALHWLLKDGTAKKLTGNPHSNSIRQMTRTPTGMVSIGLDDSMRFISGLAYDAAVVSTGELPNGVATLGNGRIVLATVSSLKVYDRSTKVNEQDVPFEISACAATGESIAAGSAIGKVYLYDAALSQKLVLNGNRATVTSIAFSPDGTKVAVGDSSGKIILYSSETGDTITTRWAFHVGRVTSLAFSPSGTKVLSASLDTHIYVWSTITPAKKIAIKNAHQGGVNGAVWTGEDSIISAGADAALKRWSNLVL